MEGSGKEFIEFKADWDWSTVPPECLQQPEETSIWYSRLLKFFMQMPEKRSLISVYRNETFQSTYERIKLKGISDGLTQKQIDNKARKAVLAKSFPTMWRDHVSKFNWHERAESWDAWTRTQERKCFEAARRAVIDNQLLIANKLSDRIHEMLNFPLTESKIEEDGRTIVIKPARWTYRDLAALLRQQADIFDKVYGSPSEEMKAIALLKDSQLIPSSVESQAAEKAEELRAVILGALEGSKKPTEDEY